MVLKERLKEGVVATEGSHTLPLPQSTPWALPPPPPLGCLGVTHWVWCGAAQSSPLRCWAAQRGSHCYRTPLFTRPLETPGPRRKVQSCLVLTSCPSQRCGQVGCELRTMPGGVLGSDLAPSVIMVGYWAQTWHHLLLWSIQCIECYCHQTGQRDFVHPNPPTPCTHRKGGLGRP